MPDAVVVGSGPNGLAAAITLARAGRSVLVVEGAETVGGGLRSAPLTGPGFIHDACSAIHPTAISSPFLSELPLVEHGLEFIHPPAPLAHPLEDGTALMLERSVDETAAQLGADGEKYRKVFGPLVRDKGRLIPFLLGPRPLPRHPIAAARFGLLGLRSAIGLTRRFEDPRAKVLFAGLAAHSIQSLRRSPTASFGLVLGLLAHAYGWPLARGGSQSIADAMASYLRSLGGEIETGRRVDSLDQLPDTKAMLLDLTPREVVRIAGSRLPQRYLRALRRYRYGPGTFKVDFALDGPVPWADDACLRAATVHIGGTLEEIVKSEDAVWQNRVSDRPFLLVAQQSLFDDSRAPAGKHTLWAYCHVPNGWPGDMTEAIEAQIERFAPGFRDRILARSTRSAPETEAYNPNFVGGDINGGVQDLRQLYTRPAIRLNPYSTPVDGLYICSSATPPGGGIHGMCGYFAATSALKA
jgi:phytoene dehydrogenase-like protein